ncbi:Interferon-induced guanylate-binding protein 1, partial [Nestor notabilis]
SKVHMAAPMCLVANTPEQGLVLQQETLQVLLGITEPVVVVAIVGPYRSGKSYLGNRLLGHRGGFSVGSSVQAHTKGIWVWCVPHPLQPGLTLVLLDTEGLGDVEKGDAVNDTWLFVLSILLSSTLIYNSRGTIDQQALDQLHYVVKLSEHIKLKAVPTAGEVEEPEKFVLFFPAFIWAVRDFTLCLEKDGKEITEDQYLEEALKLKAEGSPRSEHYNQLRECIRRFFPHRKCFTFEPPGNRKNLEHLEQLEDKELNPEFQQQMEKFCSYIWEEAPPKTIPGGHIVTGSMLVELVVSFVGAIRSGVVPCLGNAVLALAQVQNAAALKDALGRYRELMETRVKLPTATAQELQDLHAQCRREALELFMERAFEEDICLFQKDLMHQVEGMLEKFHTDNEQMSQDKCTDALRDLYQDVETRINSGSYGMVGGYQRFREDCEELVKKYQELPGKGVKADDVLEKFLQSKEDVAKTILHMDSSLTEKEKQKQTQQDEYERAMRAMEIRMKQEAESKQKLQDQARGYQE